MNEKNKRTIYRQIQNLFFVFTDRKRRKKVEKKERKRYRSPQVNITDAAITIANCFATMMRLLGCKGGRRLISTKISIEAFDLVPLIRVSILSSSASCSRDLEVRFLVRDAFAPPPFRFRRKKRTKTASGCNNGMENYEWR